jgi:NAD(P)-dependent dehydrogenase (short-subunit alcohol dehydrogenase family)
MASNISSLFDCSGLVALVLGAAGGLGSACAEALAAQGADLALADRDEAGLKQVAERVRAQGRVACSFGVDVLDSKSIEGVVQRVVADLGKLNVLVYSVGINSRKPSLEQTDHDWTSVIGTNLTGAFYACRAAGKAIVRASGGRPSGRIILLTSISSVLGHPGHAPYAASKGGMRQLIKVLASEWAPHGITVNGVAPTYIETGLTRAYLAEPGVRQRIESRIPMGRLATAEDVVGTVVYLASPAASFVTGQNIFVAGGRELD